MLQRLPIAFAQVKAGNTSENLLNKIGQTLYEYSLYWAKEITKKVCNNIMNFIKLQYKINTIFINNEPHRLLLNLADKIDKVHIKEVINIFLY